MGKVVTNLVINASEAVSPSGKIAVETGQRNGWAVLTVADNGCGMDSGLSPARAVPSVSNHQEKRLWHRHVPKQDDCRGARGPD